MNTNERIKELETKLEKMHDQIQGIDADIMIFEGELKKLKSQQPKKLKGNNPYEQLINYRDEFAPDYEPVWDGKAKNWFVYFDVIAEIWSTGHNVVDNHLTKVYMPEKVAEELARKLDAGEIVL